MKWQHKRNYNTKLVYTGLGEMRVFMTLIHNALLEDEHCQAHTVFTMTLSFDVFVG
jgi:hypothetical protein